MLETASQRTVVNDPKSLGGLTTESTSPAWAMPSDNSAGLDDMLESITIWAHSIYGVENLVSARELFHFETGKVFPDDFMHQARTAYFFDCFLFERPIRRERITDGNLLAVTPFEVFCSSVKSSKTISKDLLDRFIDLGDFRHSVYLVERVSIQSLVVQDLISGEFLTISAKPGETFRAIKRLQLIQGFLYRIGDTYQLSPGLILHPNGATKILRATIRLVKKHARFSRTTFLVKAARVNMRYLRLQHVSPKITYKTEFEPYLSTFA